MILYEYARKLKKGYKQYIKNKAGNILFPVRRIERVAPISSGKYVAMTFDDGPTIMPTNPKVSDKNLTEHLIETLEKYSAHGTFDVIGTTESNYPDEKGDDGKFEWGGKKFDHYPDFGIDKMAGVENQPELIKRMISGGHQISNHGYSHVLFGKKNMVYKNRFSFNNIYEALDDIKKLDKCLKNKFDYALTMSRPPHYVDNTNDGFTSYDIYRYLNYQYMAAIYDGGGWIASCGNYENDVEKMVAPMRKALENDPNSLNGQIIFQKDGCNMSRQTPIASALEKQLEILKKYDYKVVTVEELVKISPVEDVLDTEKIHKSLTELISIGYTVVSKNNCACLQKSVSVYEFLTMISNPQSLLAKFREIVDNHFSDNEILKAYKISPKHHLAAGVINMTNNGFISKINNEKYSLKSLLTWDILSQYCPQIDKKSENPKRIDVINAMSKIILKK